MKQRGAERKKAKLGNINLKNVKSEDANSENMKQENMKKKEIEAGIKEMSSLQLMLEGSATAKVEVTGEVFGGTRICISDVSMVTKNSMKYCKFIKQQGDVKMVAL